MGVPHLGNGLQSSLAESHRYVDDHEGHRDGDDNESEGDDHGTRAHAQDGVYLMEDPLEELGICRLAMVG